MKISFGSFALVILVILAIAVGFGNLLTTTELFNPSKERVRATILLQEANQQLALTATAAAYLNQPAEATAMAMRATTAALETSANLKIQATAVAIDQRRRDADYAEQQRAFKLEQQRNSEFMVILCAGAIIAVVCISLFAFLACELIRSNKRSPEKSR